MVEVHPGKYACCVHGLPVTALNKSPTLQSGSVSLQGCPVVDENADVAVQPLGKVLACAVCIEKIRSRDTPRAYSSFFINLLDSSY
jgi:hypothetical protein